MYPRTLVLLFLTVMLLLTGCGGAGSADDVVKQGGKAADDIARQGGRAADEVPAPRGNNVLDSVPPGNGSALAEVIGSTARQADDSLNDTYGLVDQFGVPLSQAEQEDVYAQSKRAFCIHVDVEELLDDGLTDEKIAGYLINGGAPYLDLDVNSQAQVVWNTRSALNAVAEAYRTNGYDAAVVEGVEQAICF